MTSYNSYIDTNVYGRMQLRKMKFKESFKPSMAEKIDENLLYFNYYEDLSINYRMYSYWKFFRSGQYASFRSETDNMDLNDLKKAKFVGYYNIIDNEIFIEFPNTSFNKAGKKLILKFELNEQGIKEIRNKHDTQVIYKKIPAKELKPVSPDW